LTLFIVAAGIVWSNRDWIFGAGQSAVLTGNTFRIPVIEAGKNALGYGGASTFDSVMVQVLSDKQYANHYRFKDTLQIFSPAIAGDRTRWKLEYNPELNTYILVAGERRYRLERGFNQITELKAQ
jgi:hypothetical protein